jgi:hypothetical protein
MEAANSSKMPASVYKTIQCHILVGKQSLPHKLSSEYVTNNNISNVSYSMLEIHGIEFRLPHHGLERKTKIQERFIFTNQLYKKERKF